VAGFTPHPWSLFKKSTESIVKTVEFDFCFNKKEVKGGKSMDCIFCKIASGEIPSTRVYEDDLCVAFKDLEPQAPVHILIIPREHIVSAAEITPENSSIVAHIFEVAAKLAKDNKLKNGWRIVSNVGEDGGQSVKHMHFHLLGGRAMAWPPG
jgi:histidine triad (HIT) family protein